jgi:hypothetical protein
VFCYAYTERRIFGVVLICVVNTEITRQQSQEAYLSTGLLQGELEGD